MTYPSREEILTAFRSHDIQPPDLTRLLQHWPAGISPHLELLRKDIDAWPEWVVPPGKTLEKSKQADWGFMHAMWFPYEGYEGIWIATLLNVWLFLWDDEFDTRAGSMWENFPAAEKFRQETINFVRSGLGLAASDDDNRNPYDVTSDKRIYGLGEILKEIRGTYSVFQRKIPMREIELYIREQEYEQKIRVSGVVPSVEQFCELAYGYPILELPAPVFEDPDFKIIWHHAAGLLAAVNDVYSLRKEIANDDAIDSLVAIFYAQLGSNRSIDAAWQAIVNLITDRIKEFDEAADRLSTTKRYNDIEALSDNNGTA
ncbi:hypothetical protein VTN00DRAFT_4072 [Thermoascus crustaceus]|uniref:uncharacterized protein n=1 Tax=Thermoascus crustaceus TaxID=5088 RepID=UPI0037433786